MLHLILATAITTALAVPSPGAALLRTILPSPTAANQGAEQSRESQRDTSQAFGIPGKRSSLEHQINTYLIQLLAGFAAGGVTLYVSLYLLLVIAYGADSDTDLYVPIALDTAGTLAATSTAVWQVGLEFDVEGSYWATLAGTIAGVAAGIAGHVIVGDGKFQTRGSIALVLLTSSAGALAGYKLSRDDPRPPDPIGAGPALK